MLFVFLKYSLKEQLSSIPHLSPPSPFPSPFPSHRFPLLQVTLQRQLEFNLGGGRDFYRRAVGVTSLTDVPKISVHEHHTGTMYRSGAVLGVRECFGTYRHS